MFPAFALICKCKPVFHTPEMTNIRVAAVTAPLKMCKGLKKKKKSRKETETSFIKCQTDEVYT